MLRALDALVCILLAPRTGAEAEVSCVWVRLEAEKCACDHGLVMTLFEHELVFMYVAGGFVTHGIA